MSASRIRLAGVELTRVGYTEAAIPAAFVGLDAAALATVPWNGPPFTDGDRVRVGAAAWFADVDGRRVVFDPVQAADSVLRAEPAAEATHQQGIAATFAAAGLPRESVDLVVLSHIEGVGMVAWRDADGTWSPFFPNARVLLSDAMLAAFVATGATAASASDERAAWQALIGRGVVDTFTDGETIAGRWRAEVTGAHCPGHALMHLAEADGAAVLTFVGHLAVSPLHLATGPCQALHVDADAAWTVLQRTAADGRLLVGPLWPAPGYGRWRDGGFVSGRLS